MLRLGGSGQESNILAFSQLNQLTVPHQRKPIHLFLKHLISRMSRSHQGIGTPGLKFDKVNAYLSSSFYVFFSSIQRGVKVTTNIGYDTYRQNRTSSINT